MSQSWGSSAPQKTRQRSAVGGWHRAQEGRQGRRSGRSCWPEVIRTLMEESPRRPLLSQLRRGAGLLLCLCWARRLGRQQSAAGVHPGCRGQLVHRTTSLAQGGWGGSHRRQRSVAHLRATGRILGRRRSLVVVFWQASRGCGWWQQRRSAGSGQAPAGDGCPAWCGRQAHGHARGHHRHSLRRWRLAVSQHVHPRKAFRARNLGQNAQTRRCLCDQARWWPQPRENGCFLDVALHGLACTVATASPSSAATFVWEMAELAVHAVAAAILQVEAATAALPRGVQRGANGGQGTSYGDQGLRARLVITSFRAASDVVVIVLNGVLPPLCGTQFRRGRWYLWVQGSGYGETPP